MNKTLISIVLFSMSISLAAKDKYLVYFKDKPINSVSTLQKSSNTYLDIINSLSIEAIERRKKTLGDNFLLDGDLAINRNYVEALKSNGAEIVWELKWFNAVSCFLDNQALNKIAQAEFIDRIEPVKILKYKLPDKDFELSLDIYKTQDYIYNYGSSLSQMELSEVPILHDHSISGKDVIVGLLDSGFKTDKHNVFSNMTILATKDYVFGDDDVSNDNDTNHGTGVLSLVGGFENGQLVSPAFDSKFILAKTENIFEEVNVEEDNFAAAVQWMEGLGVDIMTSSLGYSDFDAGQRSYTYADMNGETALVTRAYEAAFDRGVITVTSAGNEGNNSWQFITAPGDGKNVITVGSVNSSNSLALSSSRGPTSDGRLKPELLAQGVSTIRATQTEGGYAASNGTSFSAPIVAGIAAQLLSAYPHLSNVQIRQILLEAGDNVENPDNNRGYGLLSAKRAIEYPNVRLEGSQIEINKILLPLSEVNTDQVFLNYRINSSEGPSIIKMEFDNELKFNAFLPSLGSGDTVEIWFTYSDERGSARRQPGDVSKSYFYIQGSNHIILNVNATPPVVVPDDFSVSQNYPNPFNPSTRIEFELREKSNVRIIVYDMLGREIKVLLNEERDPGFYNDVVWNATNNHGRYVSSGPYFYVFKAGKYVDAKKMVYLR